MYAIKARFDGTNFKPMQPIPVKEDYEVVITFIEPVKKESTEIINTIKRPRSEFIGLFEGKVRMSDDFNEPLEDFSEYME
jgi:predicted DNA-binding antitoxin AbrB/MazE fold protein